MRPLVQNFISISRHTRMILCLPVRAFIIRYHSAQDVSDFVNNKRWRRPLACILGRDVVQLPGLEKLVKAVLEPGLVVLVQPEWSPG